MAQAGGVVSVPGTSNGAHSGCGLQVSGREGSESVVGQFARAVARQALHEQQRTGQERRVDALAQLVHQGGRIELGRDHERGDSCHAGT